MWRYGCIFALILMSGCGFQLRGTHDNLAATLSSLTLVDNSGDKAFVQFVAQALSDLDINVTTNAPFQLIILKTEQNKRTASFSSRAKSAEYELLKEVTFQINNQGKPITQITHLQARRSYLYRETAAVGKAEEESLLRTEMDQDLAQRIVLAIQRSARELAQ